MVSVDLVGMSRCFGLECEGLRYTSFKDMVSSVVGQAGVGWLCLEVRVDSSSKAFAKMRLTWSSGCPNIREPLELLGLRDKFGKLRGVGPFPQFWNTVTHPSDPGMMVRNGQPQLVMMEVGVPAQDAK